MPAPNEGTVYPMAFTKRVAAQVRKYGLKDWFIRQSSGRRTIDAMHAINPRIRTCPLGVDRAKEDCLEVAREHHAVGMRGGVVGFAEPNWRRGERLTVRRPHEVLAHRKGCQMKLLRRLVLPSFAMLAMTQIPVSAAEKPTPNTLWYTVPASKVIVLAHRGCWGQVPEVSIAAIKACGPIGADAAELDVRMTRDGVLVLMHDETVDRMTNGTGAIANMSAPEVRALRLKAGTGGPNAALTDELVPTLEQALEVARGKIAVNLHLKVPVEAKVAETLKRMRMTSQVTTWVSGNPGVDSLAQSPLLGAIGLIPTINECSSHHPPPCWSAPVQSLSQFAPYRPVAFFFDWMTSRDFIRQVASVDRPAGTRIFVETLNAVDQLPQAERRAEWRKLIDMGVSVIMTDHAADLIDFLRSNEVASAPIDEAKRPRAY